MIEKLFKFIKILTLLIIVVLCILGIRAAYMQFDCNIWGLDNRNHIELIKTNNTKTLNNVQNLLLNYFNVMIITKDGSDYHIFLKNPKPCDVNNAIITIAHSNIFDKNIRFSHVTQIEYILKENYTGNLVKRLENLFDSIDGVVHSNVTMTDMQQLIFCEKCKIEVNIKIKVSKSFNHTEELENIIKNILLGLDLDIKEENIKIELIKNNDN